MIIYYKMILPENKFSHLMGVNNQPHLDTRTSAHLTKSEIFIFLHFTLLFTQLHFLHSSNRPFPSCILPLCQNESKCETIHMICTYRFISRWSNSFLYERFHTKTRFETEAQGYIHPWAAHRSLWLLFFLVDFHIFNLIS